MKSADEVPERFHFVTSEGHEVPPRVHEVPLCIQEVAHRVHEVVHLHHEVPSEPIERAHVGAFNGESAKKLLKILLKSKKAVNLPRG